MKLTPRRQIAIVLTLVALIIAACIYRYHTVAALPVSTWVITYRAETGRKTTILVHAETPA
jgi:hypothetical protein